MTEAKRQEARKARFLELHARFLLLPPLSAAERAAERERESERKLSVVLVEMFGPKPRRRRCP
jgi:hypothetical protein